MGKIGGDLKREFCGCGDVPGTCVSKLKVKAGMLTPYIAIAWDELEFEDNQLDTLTNPVVIIEILSDSTELYDRTEKFAYYRAIPTLQDYILVSQKQYHVEQFTRKGGRTWEMVYYDDIGQSIQIESIGCEVPLS